MNDIEAARLARIQAAGNRRGVDDTTRQDIAWLSATIRNLDAEHAQAIRERDELEALIDRHRDQACSDDTYGPDNRLLWDGLRRMRERRAARQGDAA